MKPLLAAILLLQTTITISQVRTTLVKLTQEYREEYVDPIGPQTMPAAKITQSANPANLKVYRNGVLQGAPYDYSFDAAACPATCEVVPALIEDGDRLTLIYQ